MNQHNYIVHTDTHTHTHTCPCVRICVSRGPVDFMQFAYVNFICVISRILPSKFFIFPFCVLGFFFFC